MNKDCLDEKMLDTFEEFKLHLSKSLNFWIFEKIKYISNIRIIKIINYWIIIDITLLAYFVQTPVPGRMLIIIARMIMTLSKRWSVVTKGAWAWRRRRTKQPPARFSPLSTSVIDEPWPLVRPAISPRRVVSLRLSREISRDFGCENLKKDAWAKDKENHNELVPRTRLFAFRIRYITDASVMYLLVSISHLETERDRERKGRFLRTVKVVQWCASFLVKYVLSLIEHMDRPTWRRSLSTYRASSAEYSFYKTCLYRCGTRRSNFRNFIISSVSGSNIVLEKSKEFWPSLSYFINRRYL